MTTWKSSDRVFFRTNLDLIEAEDFSFPLASPAQVGDLIESAYTHPGGRVLELEVCRITHKKSGTYIELHLPSRWDTLTHFYEWYERLTNRKFI